MKISSSKTIGSLAIAGLVLALAPTAQAGTIEVGDPLIPAGVGLGDTFQLVFVSSTVRDASSSDIADYNDHVQTAANAASTGIGGFTWKAIASTGNPAPIVHARNNAPVTAAVYLVNGTIVADASADAFWSQTHLAPININENGSAHTGVSGTKLFNADTDPTMGVWTGTNFEGWSSQWYMGDTRSQTIDGVLVTPVSSYGWSNVSGDFSWARDEGNFGGADQSLELPFYGLSEALTVVEPSTEPSTVAITSITSLGGGVFELTLKGENSTAYEFFSSPTLDFDTGTKVLLTVSGTPDQTDVTTDGSGDATVQMSPGGSVNFVRAVGP